MENLEFEVDHTAITVSDLDRSIAWYGLFGFKERVRFERADLGVKGAILRLKSYGLELFQPYEPRPLEEFRRKLETSLPHVGPQHVALVVSDLESACAYLRSNGVEHGDMTTGKTARYVFCKDPDGMLVEVKENLK